MIKVIDFIKKNAVLTIAAIAAIITCFIVPPDAKYIEYFDFKTLACLFCVLAVVCALRNIHFFSWLAVKIIAIFGNTRAETIALVYITFIGSMFIANDMALLTFLPLGYFVLESTGKQKYMAFLFIMQNIAANLGGMLTPFGNPQNLFIYTKFNIPNDEFMAIMFKPFIVSILLITVCCIFVKKEPLNITSNSDVSPDRKKGLLYLFLSILVLAVIFRLLPYWVALIVIPLVLLFVDRNALKIVDYPLLLTFFCFFIFSGNMARIDVIRTFFENILNQNTLLVSALSCQVISNVPSAILLSEFTADYANLLMGVNIGGVGTLISSLASLITFNTYQKYNPGKTLNYILLFSALNFMFLFVLLIVCSI